FDCGSFLRLPAGKLDLKLADAGFELRDGGGFGNRGLVTKLTLAVTSLLFGGRHRPLAPLGAGPGVLLFCNTHLCYQTEGVKGAAAGGTSRNRKRKGVPGRPRNCNAWCERVAPALEVGRLTDAQQIKRTDGVASRRGYARQDQARLRPAVV